MRQRPIFARDGGCADRSPLRTVCTDWDARAIARRVGAEAHAFFTALRVGPMIEDLSILVSDIVLRCGMNAG